MNKLTFKKQVQELVGEAETEKALDLMLDFLGKQSAYLNLYNQTLQAKALYNKTKRDESQGVIASDDAKVNYNQVNKQILAILSSLDKEEESGPGASGSLQRNLLIGLILAIALSVGGYLIYRVQTQSNTNNDDDIVQGEACPDYNSPDSAFKVLILPFRVRQQTTGDTTLIDMGIANDIEERLDVFRIKHKINLGFGVKKEIGEYPNTTREAEEVARLCAANLIIWGAREQNFITTRYKFLNIEQFSLKQLVLTADSKIDTITSQTSIVTDGQLTEGIEETLQYIFGIIAHETGNQDAAIASLQNLELRDSNMSLNKDMFLADAFLQKGATEDAKKKYDEVLEKKQDYWLARQNRAALNFQKKDYVKAAQDFTIQRSTSDSTRIEVTIGEGISLLRAGNLQEAKDKLNKIAQVDTSFRRLVDSITVKLEEQEGKRKPDLDDPNVRPKSPETESLPSTKLTEEELLRRIQQNPENEDNWGKLLYKLYEKKDMQGIRRLAQKAKELGVEDNFYEHPVAQLLKDRKRILPR